MLTLFDKRDRPLSPLPTNNEKPAAFLVGLLSQKNMHLEKLDYEPSTKTITLVFRSQEDAQRFRSACRDAEIQATEDPSRNPTLHLDSNDLIRVLENMRCATHRDNLTLDAAIAEEAQVKLAL